MALFVLMSSVSKEFMPLCRLELDQMVIQATLNSKLKFVCDFLDAHLGLANAHLVNFVTDDLWGKWVPRQIQKSILPLMDDQWFTFLEEHYYPNSGHTFSNITTDGQFPYNFDGATMEQFVRRASQCHPYHLDICTSPVSLREASTKQTIGSNASYPAEKLSLDPYASEKKIHEVETMAEILMPLHTNNNIEWVIDLGSGKGYLGSFLALHCGVNVLGIDSSSSHTHGAEKRNARLQKSWTGLVRRAVQKTEATVGKKKGQSSNTSSETSDPSSSVNPAFIGSQSKRRGKYVCVTQYIDEAAQLEECLQASGIPTSTKMALVGLHTCGNLAARALELYAKSPMCQVFCSIGCCYHLMEEEFSQNPYLNPGEKPKEKCSFPLSQFLRERKFALGRNARMLGCEALDRIVANRTVPSPVLFYRSLLQVILRDKWNNTFDSTHVGKLADPNCSFVDYVQKAFQKLNISEPVSNEEIEQYLHKYNYQEKRMMAFCRIRSLLSPAIESVILLDRLLFLFEQTNVREVHLVRAFDPVISPRCFAIISVK